MFQPKVPWSDSFSCLIVQLLLPLAPCPRLSLKQICPESSSNHSPEQRCRATLSMRNISCCACLCPSLLASSCLLSLTFLLTLSTQGIVDFAPSLCCRWPVNLEATANNGEGSVVVSVNVMMWLIFNRHPPCVTARPCSLSPYRSVKQRLGS